MSLPSHIDIESTNRCQLSCRMCPFRIMKRTKGDMPWAIFKKIIDECQGARTCYLHQIGEPLLHSNIFGMINYAHHAGIRTSISTNALLLKERTVEILKSSLDELTLALDGLDSEIYGRFRDKRVFWKVYHDIVAFLKCGFPDSLHVQVQLIEMEGNRNQVDEFRYRFGRYNVEVLVKPFSTFAGNVEDLGYRTKEKAARCSKLYNSITFNRDGIVVICCRDFDHFTVVGNIARQSLREIWEGEPYQTYREAFLKKDWETLPFCGNCERN